MGLLDQFFGQGFDDPRSQANMALASGLLGGSFAQGVQGYGNVMAGAKDADMKRKYSQMQMDNMQSEIDQRNQAAQQKRAMEALAAKYARPEVPMAADGYGPSAPASFDRQGYATELESKDPMAGLQYASSIQKQAPKLTAYKPGDSVRNESGVEVFSIPQAPKDPKELDPNKPFMLVDGKIVPNEAYQAFELRRSSNSAPKMSVDLRDPTAVANAAMKFQNDYRAATKPSYARAQAYEAMTQASATPSAKGDLTMVYSFVKALDPESVVREGEIGLLNANRNVPDQIKGYAQRLATGQSLLPKEREDLLNQARTLTQTDYTRSRNDIKAYRDNAQRLGLDPELYAPDPYKDFEKKGNPKAAKTVVKTGMYGGR